MNFRSLPYSLLGLMLVTISMSAIVYVHDGLNSSELEPHGATVKYTYSTEDPSSQSVVDSLVEKRKRPEANLLASFTAQSEAAEVVLAEDKNDQYECGETATDAQRYAFEVVTPYISYQLDQGEKFEVDVIMKNTGTSVWCGENTYMAGVEDVNQYKLRLATARPYNHKASMLAGDQTSVPMVTPEGLVLPGETVVFKLEGRAPKKTGIYREYLQANVDGLQLFPEAEVAFDLYVGDYTEADLNKHHYLRQSGSTNDIDPSQPLKINVDLSEQIEYVYLGDKLLHSYKVSSGAAATPTPIGVYEIHNKQELRIGGKAPHYRMPWWIGLKRSGDKFRGYGLHGLPYLGNVTVDDNGQIVTKGNFWQEAVGHLGTRVSHGCVRRGDSDAEWLWQIVDPQNTTVEVFRDFDPVAYEAMLLSQKLAASE